METSLLGEAIPLSRALKGKCECTPVGTQLNLKGSLRKIEVEDNKLIHLKSRDQCQLKYCIVTEKSEPSEK